MMVRERVRRAVQLGSLLATNLYYQGFIHGTIFTGGSKIFCIPGLHCYSCPSSVLACPVGSLQNILSTEGFVGGLATGRSDAITLLGVLGFLLVFGFLAGRFACGWLCPFGLLQDLLYGIPSPKLKVPASWRDAKYAILLIFVIILPLTIRTVPGAGGDPWFCKAVCPSGTLTAGIPLVLHHGGDTLQTGFLFTWKTAVMVLILLWVITSRRAFCRVVCPLGAFWGLAGKVSVFRMRVDGSCIRCGRCREVCPVDIAIYEEPDSAECVRCGKCIDICPVGAIHHDTRRDVGAGKT
ncbi:MAG: 4Fe-4S binding protein [Candidatus Fermentibacteraceae bacterium]|nr:4Fe-4S binding protein [Candidatus Fermentibacteraceae bacterium]